MTNNLKLPKISVKALFPSAALKHGHNESLQMRMRHNNRIIRAGGRYNRLSKNPEKRIDQLLEKERIRKSRKITSLIHKRDHLSDENPEERNTIREQINEKINISYVRVSTYGQRDDLERQKIYMENKTE